MNNQLTLERLKELLAYEPDTGNLYWIKKPNKNSPNVKLNVPITTIGPDGYLKVVVDGKVYKAHRLAWLYVYGAYPTGLIDHINRDKTDNRISNLRDVSVVGNQLNTKRVENAKGYSWCNTNKKWRAQISIKGKKYNLGYYDNEDDARNAYVKQHELRIKMEFE